MIKVSEDYRITFIKRYMEVNNCPEAEAVNAYLVVTEDASTSERSDPSADADNFTTECRSLI